MIKKYLVIPVLLLLLISGCASNRLHIEKPKENYIEIPEENTLSTIAISLDVDMDHLEKTVNSMLPSVLYEDNTIEDDNLMIKVWKAQAFRFKINGNRISCSIPLTIWAQIGFKKTVLGVTVQQYVQASGAITVNLSTSFQIQNDWKLTTTTTLENFKWTEKPTINIVGISLPVTTIADITINALRENINRSINEAVESNLDIKSIMEDTWKKTQDLVLLNEEYDAWLKISPENIYSTSFSNANNHLYLHLGLDAVIETSVGKKPKTAKKAPLPGYKQLSKIKPDFNLNLNVDVDMTKLKEIAKGQIIGMTFNQAKKKITIEEIDFFGHDGNLVVEVHVKGSVNGKLYCTGKLFFDNETQSLQITGFDFDVKTKNTLLKTADWIMHKKFLNLIAPYLTISLKEEIKEVLKSGNEMLDNYTLMKGVTLKGNIDHVILNTIHITSSSIIVDGSVKGNVKLFIKQLEF